MLKFYKKLSPQTEPVLSTGLRVKFKTNDFITGYYATDNEFVQSQFAQFQAEQRYGITEIQYDEFSRDYLEKKNPSTQPRPLYREEISSGASSLLRLQEQQARLRDAAAAVGVSGSDVPRSSPVSTAVAGPAEAAKYPDVKPKEEFKPKAGKRVPKKAG